MKIKPSFIATKKPQHSTTAQITHLHTYEYYVYNITGAAKKKKYL